MRKRKTYDPAFCRKCRFRGFFDYDTQVCCNYLWITGKPRILLPPREDGRCPAYEEGDQEYSQITQIAVKVPTDRPMYKTQYVKEQMKALYDKGMIDREIAAEMKCHEKTVALWRRKEGLPANRKYKPAVDPKVFESMYKLGYSDQKISKLTGCHHSVVANWRHKNDLPPVDKGGKKPIFDRARMRELYDRGLYDSQIAREMGCNESAVKHWRDKEGLKAQTKREDLK